MHLPIFSISTLERCEQIHLPASPPLCTVKACQQCVAGLNWQGSPNAFFQLLVIHELPRPGRGGRGSPSGRGKWWAPCTRCIRGGCVAPHALAPPTVLDLTPRQHVLHAWVLFVGHWLSAFGVPVLPTLAVDTSGAMAEP